MDTTICTDVGQCLTVADLIDLYTKLHTTRPPKSANGDDGAREDHLRREGEVEEVLATALAYYGTVVWRGQTWWTKGQPRLYKVNHTAFGGFGHNLRWPPNRPDTKLEEAAKAILAFPNEPDPDDKSVPPIPEKIGGFISTDKFSQ